MTELILDSLRRRIKALHSLYDDATSTMTIEQVNHFGRVVHVDDRCDTHLDR